MDVMHDSTFVVIQGAVFEFRPRAGEDALACFDRTAAYLEARVTEQGVFKHESPRPRDMPDGPKVVSFCKLQPGMTIQIFPGDTFQRFMREQQAAAMQQQVRQHGSGLIRS